MFRIALVYCVIKNNPLSILNLILSKSASLSIIECFNHYIVTWYDN